MDTFRPLILTDRLDTVHTVRNAIKQADRVRNDVFEIRNLLRQECELAVKTQYEIDDRGLQDCEREAAYEAALKAAEEVVTKVTILHRNLMTVLGYRYSHIDPGSCCERDHDGDGNCDRHPPITYT